MAVGGEPVISQWISIHVCYVENERSEMFCEADNTIFFSPINCQIIFMCENGTARMNHSRNRWDRRNKMWRKFSLNWYDTWYNLIYL